MEELTPSEQELWNEVIKGTTKLILTLTAFLILGVVIIATAANGQPLWCLVVSLVTIALGKKVYDAMREAKFGN